MQYFLELNSGAPCTLRGVVLSADCNHLYGIDFVNGKEPSGIFTEEPVGVLLKAVKQLQEYMAGARTVFDVPLQLEGTAFQQEVWRAIAQIPYGMTATYADIAQKVGSRNKARAVGGAANCNPLPIIIPCHRVIGSGGSLTGFAAGLAIKEFLLKHECQQPKER